MIMVKQISEYEYALHMDVPDVKAVRKLADAYGIPFKDMIIGCLNKGIYVIGKQVSDADAHKESKRLSQEDH